MVLTSDSGSTKTTWLVQDGSRRWTLTTDGINPYHQSYDTVRDTVRHQLLRHADCPNAAAIHEVHFFGAGCTAEKAPLLQAILEEAFPHATCEVGSDMLGAARALFNDKPGIACILGTGANSCLYDGRQITHNISPLGYILGDEGSGAVLGRTFINLLYKEQRDAALIADFEHSQGLTLPDIVNRVYREPMPNRFLASMAPYIKQHLALPWVEAMVLQQFRLFFQHNVRHYSSQLPCAFVGSIAFYFADLLRKAAQAEGFQIDRIIKEPLSC